MTHVVDHDRGHAPGCPSCYLRTGETVGRAYCRSCEQFVCLTCDDSPCHEPTEEESR